MPGVARRSCGNHFRRRHHHHRRAFEWTVAFCPANLHVDRESEATVGTLRTPPGRPWPRSRLLSKRDRRHHHLAPLVLPRWLAPSVGHTNPLVPGPTRDFPETHNKQPPTSTWPSQALRYHCKRLKTQRTQHSEKSREDTGTFRSASPVDAVLVGTRGP